MSNPAQPIYIIKKKVYAAGHHGGAWKVAYADFVTAMMAFFLVMWLMGTSDNVKKAVSGYFTDPSGAGKETGSGQAGAGEQLSLSKDDMPKLKEKIEAAMKEMPEFQQLKDQVKFTVTGEGLRIEMLETEKGMFFTSGSASPSSQGEELLLRMAGELGKLPNNIMIEGHTDAKPLGANGNPYSNWELSADRANSARRLMQKNGLRVDQVKQVRGYADQRLFKPDEPLAAANRRVSVIIQYLTPKAAPPDEKAKDHSGHKAGEKSDHGNGHAATHDAAPASAHNDSHGSSQTQASPQEDKGHANKEHGDKAHGTKHDEHKTDPPKAGGGH
jgi:chemotaxis protein MotB